MCGRVTRNGQRSRGSSAPTLAHAPSYPPPCGEGRRAKRGGVGVEREASLLPNARPPPLTPPHKGEGNTPAYVLIHRESCTAPIAIVTAAWVGSITGMPSASSSGL